MIPQPTIQQILDTAKIEEVVGDFIQLRRRGINLIGLCPFHNEKTPSFNVSPVRNIFKCFGCGEGGSAVNFVMKHENCSYPEAIRYLAKKYNIHIEEETPSDEYRAQQQLADSLYLINDFAQRHFHSQLFGTEYGISVGLSYFKERGLREDTIQKFGLGFANGQQNDLTQTMLQRKYELPLLQKAGLTSQSTRDFFRLRVMFPIHNVAGKVVGFGGRILTNDKNQPKYINTPETEIYNKSKSLYGIYFAKKAITQADECWLVEGYTDVLALHQAGMENVVASSGTSLTVGQIQLIKRYTNNITILYDGDAAGVKAALRGLDLVLEQGMNVKIVLLPSPEDPDSFVRKMGETAFREYVDKHKEDFILFKTGLLLKDTQRDPIARAQAMQDILTSIAKIGDALKRAIYVKECSQIFQIEEGRIHQEINKLLVKHLQEAAKASESASPTAAPADEPVIDTTFVTPHAANIAPTTSQEYQERDVVRLLIQFGHRPYDERETVAEFVLSNMLDLLDEFDNDLYAKVIMEYIERLEEEKPTTTEHFTHHAEADIQQLAVDILTRAEQYTYSPNWERLQVFLQSQQLPDKNHIKDSMNGVLRFKLRKIERVINKNNARIKELQTQTQQESAFAEIMLCMKVHQKLTTLRAELAQLLNTVVLK